MTNPDTLRFIMILLGCFTTGAIVGYIYFNALRITAEMIAHSKKPLFSIALTFGRLTLMCTAFYFAVQISGLALLVMFAGVMSARAITVQHTRQFGR